MFLHVGGSMTVKISDVIAILDLDTDKTPETTKKYLSHAEKNGKVILSSNELPKSAVLADDGEGGAWVIFSHISARSLSNRAEMSLGLL